MSFPSGRLSVCECAQKPAKAADLLFWSLSEASANPPLHSPDIKYLAVVAHCNRYIDFRLAWEYIYTAAPSILGVKRECTSIYSRFRWAFKLRCCLWLKNLLVPLRSSAVNRGTVAAFFGFSIMWVGASSSLV